MSKKIFQSILSVAICTLVVTLAIITYCMYGYFGGVQESQLNDELEIALQGTALSGEDFLNGLSTNSYRVTWIGKDGTVLFDNKSDAVSMENHAQREEVKEAFSEGTGSSVRYSTTLTEKTIYKAKRLSDGTVLRISDTRLTVGVLLVGMLQPILLIAVVAIILSAILGKRMSNRIVEPLNHLDLENPMQNDAYEELSPLLRRIDAQHKEIKMQWNELEQKRDEFEQITRNMHEGLILLNPEGNVISINLAAKKLFNVAGECLGRDFLNIYRKISMNQAIKKARMDGFAHLRENINGLDYQFDISRIDYEGKMIGEVLLAFDITSQVHAEQSRREFTANVSHELKTPLQGILGYTDLIEKGLAKTEDIPRFVSKIKKDASRLVLLIEDIIRLSQLDEGMDIPLEDVSLLHISEEVKESFEDVARIKNVEISVNGDDGVILGANKLLYEIVYNLCDNAVKYNRTDGTVSISIKDDDNKVILSVNDTGIGIPAEDQERIFERFYRVDKSHSKQSGGTGLGLSIVKHAVAFHKGRIELESKLGEGTTILVTFAKDWNVNDNV